MATPPNPHTLTFSLTHKSQLMSGPATVGGLMEPQQNAGSVQVLTPALCSLFQFQLLPSALFKSSSDFIPLGKTSFSLSLPLIGTAKVGFSQSEGQTFLCRLLRPGPDLCSTDATLRHPRQLLSRKHDPAQGQPGRPHHPLAHPPARPRGTTERHPSPVEWRRTRFDLLLDLVVAFDLSWRNLTV